MATKTHTKTQRKKSTPRKAAARGPASTVTIAQLGTRIPVQIGDVFGYIAKAGAARAVEALREIGFTTEAPRAAAGTSEPSMRRLTNRVAILNETDVNMPELEDGSAHKSMEFRLSLLCDSLTIAEAKEILGVASQQTIHNWIREKKILALPDRHRLMIPRWQFDPETKDGIVRGLRDVLEVIDASSFGIAYWLISRNTHLENESPIELLRRGRVTEVVEEARGVGVGQ